jgi:hypothetical protein
VASESSCMWEKEVIKKTCWRIKMRIWNIPHSTYLHWLWTLSFSLFF